MQLPIARYRFTFLAQTEIKLPGYPGSTLRGVFGRALKQLACITRQPHCAQCPLLNSCAYTQIFEPLNLIHQLQQSSQAPRPYIIEPEPQHTTRIPPGNQLRFNMVLIGTALQQLPLIILAWQRALKLGMGKDDGRAELIDVAHQQHDSWQSIWNANGQATLHNASIQINTKPCEQVTLHFITPLRLQHNGKPLNQHTITTQALLRNILRRNKLMLELHCNQMADIPFDTLNAKLQNIADKKELEWFDWQRYSSRQQKKMALGGLVGEWTMTGPITPFIPWLQLGEWLHVGKETTFGLGQYQLCY